MAAKSELRYIDSHSHVWTPEVTSFPAANGVKVGDHDAGWTVESWTGERLLQAAAPSGVGRVVLISHGMIYGYDNTYMLDCARQHPGKFRIVGAIDDRRPPEEVAATMRSLLQQGVTGFRLSPGELGKPFGRTRDDWLSTEGMQTMWKTAAETRQAMCGLVNVGAALDAFERMVAAYPETVAVIDHFSRIGVEGSAPEQSIERLCELARYPNLYVKVSAFYALGQATPPYRDMLPFVRRLVEAFGARRLMWGSDCPYQIYQHNPPFNPNAKPGAVGSYDSSIAVIRDHADFLSESEKEQILGLTAERVFFFDQPASAL